MIYKKVFIAPLLGLFLLAPGLIASPFAKHVFIISFDQGNPDTIQKADMPVFHAMAREGARTWSAYTIVPSSTLPSHTSMLTGVGIQAHQILWNSYREDREPLSVPTIFGIAKEAGLTTAMFVGKEKFRQLDLPGTLDRFVWPQPEDNALAVAAAFANQVAELKPNLCFIHFRDPDSMGHRHGTESAEKFQAFIDSDAALGLVKQAVADAGLLDDSVFILTADHGSHDTTNKAGEIVGTHGTAEREDVLIPWIVWGAGVKQNFTVTRPVVQYDTAATALWALGIPVPESFWGRPVTTAFESRVSSEPVSASGQED